MKKNNTYTRKLGIAILTVLLFSACYKPIPVEKPILEEAKIKLILRDIHLAEALITETMDRRAKDSLARVYYAHILQIHQVKAEDFDQSMHAYFTDPAALDSLYDEVLKELVAGKASNK